MTVTPSLRDKYSHEMLTPLLFLRERALCSETLWRASVSSPLIVNRHQGTPARVSLWDLSCSFPYPRWPSHLRFPHSFPATKYVHTVLQDRDGVERRECLGHVFCPRWGYAARWPYCVARMQTAAPESVGDRSSGNCTVFGSISAVNSSARTGVLGIRISAMLGLAQMTVNTCRK
jgi:hypothetical protein